MECFLEHASGDVANVVQIAEFLLKRQPFGRSLDQPNPEVRADVHTCILHQRTPPLPILVG